MLILLLFQQVIEKRAGGSEGSEQEQVKGRITAQLEVANERIKMLEAQLVRLRFGPWALSPPPPPPPNRWADEAQVHHNDLVDDHSLD